MKTRLLLLLPTTILGCGLFVGGGTYALLTSSITNGPNQFSTFHAETVNIQSAGTTATASPMLARAMFAAASKTQQVQFPMFYDSGSYPNGPNPYDVKVGTPSGEIPGGWAPGDQVRRLWAIQNSGSGSKITEITAQLDSLTDKYGNPVKTGTALCNEYLGNMNVSVYPSTTSTTPIYTGTFLQLVSGPQYLNTVICLSKNTTSTLSFVASMNLSAGNDLQGMKGVVDFSVGAEQTVNNCFDPPFSNEDYSMKIGSTTPIKFEDYDSNGNLITSTPSNVNLVITGPKVGGGTLTLTYSLGNSKYPLSLNGGHYQAQVYGDPSLFLQESDTTPWYTASVYVNGQLCCQKSFSTYPGNRSNS